MGKSLKGKELGPGISQRKDGTYQARFIDRFGKRVTIYDKTITGINKKLRDAKYEDDKELNVADNKITLDEWFDIWIKLYKKNCRDTSIRFYRIVYNRLKEELGWRKISSINSIVIQNVINNLKTDASREDCKILLVGMFNDAIKAELIQKNPATNIIAHIDNNETEEKRILTDEEIEWVYSYGEKSMAYPMIVICLETGMRIGEVLGLTWDDIDFDNNIIKVRHTLARLPNNGNPIFELHQPKTKSGRRNIPMSKLVRKVLLEKKIMSKNISNYRGFETLVFTTRGNNPYGQEQVLRAIYLIARKIQKDHPEFKRFSMHGLRHTFATKCIAKGMKPKVLQKILGHSSLSMTMDLYCHVTDETIEKEMSLVVDL